MSTKYSGAIISKTPPTPSGPYANSTAPGVWTLEQQAYWQKLGQWPTQGAVDPNIFIENLFSTYLWTNVDGTSNPVANGIDLSTKGGLVWMKPRASAGDHQLYDSARGTTSALSSNTTAAQTAGYGNITYNTDGFTKGSGGGNGTFVGWTFRKQPKFFDIVTYTGTGSVRTVSHNLGSAPGFMIIKRTDSADEWFCYHTSLGAGSGILLNQTLASFSAPNYFNSTAPTSTVFTLGTDSGLNGNGYSYVAYLFASNAGGFGLTGTDNVISCGSFTTDGSGNATVNLGYEPQWILIKAANAVSNWVLLDTMRGWPVQTGGSTKNLLYANASDAELASGGIGSYSPTATGFTFDTGAASRTNIYIAIRRGPMAVPTDATKVFTPITATPTDGASTSIAVTPDMFLFKGRNIADPFWTEDRLRSFALTDTGTSGKQLQVNSTAAQQSQYPIAYYIQNANMKWGNYLASTSSIIYNFKRAPSVFDEVAFPASTSTAVTLNHNLGVAPEMIILKATSGTSTWHVYSSALGITKKLRLETTDAIETLANNPWGSSAPTSTTFTFNQDFLASASTGIAYLFATCAGVSKVGSYTGTGSTQTIDCGFTGGARFVLIKRSSSSGSWWVWDTARGMVSGNDRRSALNTTASEVNADWVYTTTGGFQIVTSDAEVNASGGTYIFLAIA